MPMPRAAAEMEPVAWTLASRAALPGPIRAPEPRTTVSFRRATCPSLPGYGAVFSRGHPGSSHLSSVLPLVDVRRGRHESLHGGHRACPDAPARTTIADPRMMWRATLAIS